MALGHHRIEVDSGGQADDHRAEKKLFDLALMKIGLRDRDQLRAILTRLGRGVDPPLVADRLREGGRERCADEVLVLQRHV
jgi:hypothetical protein